MCSIKFDFSLFISVQSVFEFVASNSYILEAMHKYINMKYCQFDGKYHPLKIMAIFVDHRRVFTRLLGQAEAETERRGHTV
jgi:hypothetical protein